jgi:Type IV secretion system proteins
MRKNLIAVACIVVGIGGPAQAQIAVDSLTADFNAVKDLAGQAKSYALQAQQYVTEAQQLAQLVNTFNAFVANPSLGAALGLMNQTGLGNDLPINPAGLMSLTSGYSMSLANLGAKLSALSSLSNASYTQNHVYTCTDQSWACTQEQQRGYGLAGSSGIAQSAYQDLRNHMPVIQALRDQAATATTPAQRENVALALQSETAWNNNLAAQIQAAQMQAKSDEGSLAQQDTEKMSQALDQTYTEIP